LTVVVAVALALAFVMGLTIGRWTGH